MKNLGWTITWVLGLALAAAGVSRASNWAVVLNAPNQVASPGGMAVYSGTITNTTGGDLSIDVSLDLLSSPETDDFTVEFSAPFLNLLLTIPPSGYSGPIFQITWGTNVPLGTYGSGALEFSSDNPADPSVVSVPFTLRTPGIGAFCKDNTGFQALSCSVASDDSSGTAVIAYNDPGASLRYASSNGQSWTSELVGSGIGTAATPSLRLDGVLRPQIAYYRATTGDLYFAAKPGATWLQTAVDTGGDVGVRPHLVLDAFGDAHVSYYARDGRNLKYAKRTAGVWSVDFADTTGAVGEENAIALDASGNPYIAYYDATLGVLKLAAHQNGFWTVETVDAGGTVGTSPSIQIAGGVIAISYRDESAHLLKLATGVPGHWTIEVADAAGNPGFSSSLALNTFGQPRVAYYNAATGEVKYAAKVDAATWERGTVDGGASGAVSLAQNRDGEPFVAYLSAGGGLRLASIRSCATVAAPEVADQLGAVLQLLPNHPNPLSQRTVIAFIAARRASVQVRVFDAAGRVVAKPFDQIVEPGQVSVEWNGAGLDGRPLPSGVYLYQVRSQGESRNGRLVLIR